MLHARSNRADVRNPILACPAAVAALETLDADQAEALAAVLHSLSADWVDRANKLWRKHKPPMASYWKINAVNARHIARAIRSRRRQQELEL
jgi:hypothetical protein